jgi:hypothetical protein
LSWESSSICIRLLKFYVFILPTLLENHAKAQVTGSVIVIIRIPGWDAIIFRSFIKLYGGTMPKNSENLLAVMQTQQIEKVV